MPRQRIPLPKGVPRTLRFQSVTFDVAALGDGRLAFGYYDGSRRIVVKRRTLDELRDEAGRLALAILNAETAAHDLTADLRRIAAAAFAALDGTGASLDAVARDAAEAFKITKGAVSIADLARHYARTNPSGKAAPPTPQILAALLGKVADDRRSAEYRRGLARDLAPFATRFPVLTDVSEEDVREYLRGLVTRSTPKRPARPVSDRRRDNVRDALVTFFRFARDDREWLAPGRITAAERVPRVATGGDVSTYTPAQLDLLLCNAGHRWRPLFAIAAFAGLRTSELFRLDWSAVKWEQRVIAVSRRIAKKVRVSRLVPTTDALLDWLAPWRQSSGPLYAGFRTLQAFYKAEHRELERLHGVTGLTTHRNALRHSFGSYRMAVVKIAAQVALEMGNSPAQIREHYHDPKGEDEAKTWFALLPPERRDDHIISLPLEFTRAR
ncbi:MAG: site-specific integrase [Chthoniobacteraceae bacterium]